ncbi:MAG: YraN family protein [Pseudomonadota bacterium]
MSRPTSAQTRGQSGEQRALEHLQHQGLKLVARNAHARGGELDLVMLDGATLVFIEVRSRAAGGLVGAMESISPAKRQRILNAARAFLARHTEHAGRACRFDVIAITHDYHGDTLEWAPNAFEA